ncbi:MAG: DUF4864 domain-containing protein [Acidobacteria bacterium]|nr:DUF4864 domain-containing protein [Acidobacteriota bacterium]
MKETNFRLEKLGKPANSSFGMASTQRLRRFQRRGRKIVGILITGLLIALGCVALLAAISWVRSQPAVKVVQAQIQAMQEGKVEQAYAFFSSEYQTGMTLPMFRRWLRRQRRLTHLRSLQFWGRSVWGGTALLRGNFQDDLGNRYPFRYLLIREDGSWRVRYFQLSAEAPDFSSNQERFLHI